MWPIIDLNVIQLFEIF